jgi:hypothetical protein
MDGGQSVCLLSVQNIHGAFSVRHTDSSVLRRRAFFMLWQLRKPNLPFALLAYKKGLDGEQSPAGVARFLKYRNLRKISLAVCIAWI